MADDGTPPSPARVTALLKAWGDGDQAALQALLPLVEQELHRLAAHYMRGERPGHTLQPTALVHEAFLRLLELNDISWQDRSHFVALCAQMMRRVLINQARAKLRQKRGGRPVAVSFDENVHGGGPVRETELLAIDEAITRLARDNERHAQVAVLRYFGGLSVEETAEALKLSPATVKRDWAFVKAWLFRELKSDE